MNILETIHQRIKELEKKRSQKINSSREYKDMTALIMVNVKMYNLIKGK